MTLSRAAIESLWIWELLFKHSANLEVIESFESVMPLRPSTALHRMHLLRRVEVRSVKKQTIDFETFTDFNSLRPSCLLSQDEDQSALNGKPRVLTDDVHFDLSIEPPSKELLLAVAREASLAPLREDDWPAFDEAVRKYWAAALQELKFLSCDDTFFKRKLNDTNDELLAVHRDFDLGRQLVVKYPKGATLKLMDGYIEQAWAELGASFLSRVEHEGDKGSYCLPAATPIFAVSRHSEIAEEAQGTSTLHPATEKTATDVPAETLHVKAVTSKGQQQALGASAGQVQVSAAVSGPRTVPATESPSKTSENPSLHPAPQKGVPAVADATTPLETERGVGDGDAAEANDNGPQVSAEREVAPAMPAFKTVEVEDGQPKAPHFPEKPATLAELHRAFPQRVRLTASFRAALELQEEKWNQQRRLGPDGASVLRLPPWTGEATTRGTRTRFTSAPFIVHDAEAAAAREEEGDEGEGPPQGKKRRKLLTLQQQAEQQLQHEQQQHLPRQPQRQQQSALRNERQQPSPASRLQQAYASGREAAEVVVRLRESSDKLQAMGVDPLPEARAAAQKATAEALANVIASSIPSGSGSKDKGADSAEQERLQAVIEEYLASLQASAAEGGGPAAPQPPSGVGADTGSGPSGSRHRPLMNRQANAQQLQWDSDEEIEMSEEDATPGGAAPPCLPPRVLPIPPRSPPTLSSPSQVARATAGNVVTGAALRRRANSPWNTEEALALIKGVQTHGRKWQTILKSNPVMFQDRSDVDLKDKYRNLVKYGWVQQQETAGVHAASPLPASGAIQTPMPAK
eukprot:TRINITY_DN19428_c0_g2_i1.p1 TRINITY_DN19428_c0_g2~~TRINITY_DN19428_c0_g2_i1.p1  ORF type:complete len:803 (-),score=182.68 TRINITY_DN19428_c0_g2_i1:1832-4240(-)